MNPAPSSAAAHPVANVQLPAVSPIRYRHAEVDGRRMFYREAGQPGTPAVVLLHGFPSSSHMFRGLIPLLADRFHMIAPDFPGFGYSDSPPPDEFSYTFDHLSEVVDRLLVGLNIERFALFVHDYGGPVGFRLAAAHPERVMALMIQNANAYEEGLTSAWAPLRAYWADPTSPDREADVRGLLTRATTQFQYTHGVADPTRISPDAIAHDQAGLDRPGNDLIQLALFRDYRHNLDRYPAWHDYFRTYRPPTLVIWGENDPFFGPEGARAFARDNPATETHLLSTGHFALEDHEREIAAHARDFLGRHLGA